MSWLPAGINSVRQIQRPDPAFSSWAGTMPVCRGGSFLNETSWASGSRMGYLTSDRGHWAYGFRVVRELPEKKQR